MSFGDIVKKEREEGKPEKQSVAIAYSEKGEHRLNGGEMEKYSEGGEEGMDEHGGFLEALEEAISQLTDPDDKWDDGEEEGPKEFLPPADHDGKTDDEEEEKRGMLLI